MKIIHLISGGDVGGAKTHVHLLLEGLTKTDTVQLICFTDGPFAQEAAALGIPTQVVDTGISATVSRLQALIRDEKYELIHCHGARANMIGMLLKRKLDLPVVTTVHSDYRLDYLGRPFAALTYGMINKLALRKLDSWIGVSDATAEMLVSRGFDPQRVFRLYNSVRFDNLSCKLSRKEFFESVGLSVTEQSVVFGIAARISPVKDMETLIRAFAQTVRAVPDTRLLIAGDGEQRQELEKLAAELCPSGSYRFCGWLDDVDSFYNAIDVNMLTSVSEGFPYALPEGARMHCATIASRVGGVPEIIVHEVNGLLFTPKDLGTLQAHMLRLVQEPALRKTFADRLFAKTEQDFSMDAMLRSQRAIYSSVLKQYRRRRERKRDGIVLCGAYGKGNSGDEAILSVILAQLLAHDPEMPITVLSRKPKETRRVNRVNSVHTFSLLRVFRAMRKSMLYLSGGGSLIQDATSTRSLLYYLHSIRDAKKRGCKVMMFGCGIGPVNRTSNRKRAGKYITKYVDRISLRDAQSQQELEALGVSGVPVTVTADMALLLAPADAARADVLFSQNGLSAQEKYLLLAPRPWVDMEQHLPAFAEAAVYAKQQYGLSPLLLSMEPKRDRPVCEQLSSLLQAKGISAAVLDAPADASLCVAVVQRASAVLSMRLHTLIFAAGQGVPCAGIVYDPKVSGFLQSLGNRNLCSLEEADESRLLSMIDALFIPAEASAETLRASAAENVRLAYEMIE